MVGTPTFKTQQATVEYATGASELDRLLGQQGTKPGTSYSKPQSDFERLLEKKPKSEFEKLLEGDHTPKDQKGKYPKYPGEKAPKPKRSPWVRTQAKLDQVPPQLRGGVRVGAQDIVRAANHSRAVLDGVISAVIKEFVQTLINEAMDMDSWNRDHLLSTKWTNVGPLNTSVLMIKNGTAYQYYGSTAFDASPDGSFTYTHRDTFNNALAWFYPNGASEQEVYAADRKALTASIVRNYPSFTHYKTDPLKLKTAMVRPEPDELKNQMDRLKSLWKIPRVKEEVITLTKTGSGGPPHIGRWGPKGKKPEHVKVKTSTGAFRLLNAALDWTSELGEAFMILKDAAGWSPGSDNLEFMKWLIDGGWRQIDASELAYGLALNIILDKITGPILGKYSKTVRGNQDMGGPSTTTAQWMQIGL